jgi:D-alanine-D-alanine ligase
MSAVPGPILILHHTAPAAGSGPHVESDAGVMDEVAAVAQALDTLGVAYRIASVGSLAALPPLLAGSPEPIVFNLVENFPGCPADAPQVPILCEAAGKACTGNDSVCQTLALDKWRTKAILSAAGLPVPAGLTVHPGGTLVASRLPPPPWIVKPLLTDASEGIHARSVVTTPRALRMAIRDVHRHFHHPALIEQYFGSREFNIGIFAQGSRLVTLPEAEIEFRNFSPDRPRILDYASKWRPDSFEYQNTVRVIPAKIPPRLATRLRTAALAAWQVSGCQDYARIDFRMDAEGRIAILEVNPNPDISPEGGFAAGLKAAGIPYRQFVKTLIRNASGRLRRPLPPPPREARKGTRKPAKAAVTLRQTRPEDRDEILAFMRGTGFFHEGELEVAREVLDEAIAKGPSGHYQSFTLLSGGLPKGWVCHGPTPCTAGTYDIYWIGVSADSQGFGYGRLLLEEAERQIRERGGRLAILETSGRPHYEATRGFYLKLGYREMARVPHFYAPGDDRVIYGKSLLFA